MALTASSEAELRALADKLGQAGLPHQLIIESDAPYADQATALGIAPMERKSLKKFLSELPLLK